MKCRALILLACAQIFLINTPIDCKGHSHGGHSHSHGGHGHHSSHGTGSSHGTSGHSGSSHHTYPSSLGYSGSSSGHGESSSSGSSHSYPASSGYSGSSSGLGESSYSDSSHSYPSSSGYSGSSSGHGDSSYSGSSHSYPPSSGYSGSSLSHNSDKSYGGLSSYNSYPHSSAPSGLSHSYSSGFYGADSSYSNSSVTQNYLSSLPGFDSSDFTLPPLNFDYNLNSAKGPHTDKYDYLPSSIADVLKKNEDLINSLNAGYNPLNDINGKISHDEETSTTVDTSDFSKVSTREKPENKTENAMPKYWDEKFYQNELNKQGQLYPNIIKDGKFIDDRAATGTGPSSKGYVPYSSTRLPYAEDTTYRPYEYTTRVSDSWYYPGYTHYESTTRDPELPSKQTLQTWLKNPPWWASLLIVV